MPSVCTPGKDLTYLE